MYVDHGLTGTNRERPGLRQALAACRAGDTRVGPLRGKQPKLKPRQEAHLVELYRSAGHAVSELEELFGVSRSMVYRAVAPRRRELPAHGCSTRGEGPGLKGPVGRPVLVAWVRVVDTGTTG